MTTPLCDFCKQPAQLKLHTSIYRRGDRSVEVETDLWECPSNCTDWDGNTPYQFLTFEMLKAHDELAKTAWLLKWGENMPPSKRKKRHERKSGPQSPIPKKT